MNSNDVGDYPVARAANAPATETQTVYTVDRATQTITVAKEIQAVGFSASGRNEAQKFNVDITSELLASNQADTAPLNTEVKAVPGAFLDKSLLTQQIVTKPSQQGRIAPQAIVGRYAQSLPNAHNARPPVLARKKIPTNPALVAIFGEYANLYPARP